MHTQRDRGLNHSWVLCAFILGAAAHVGCTSGTDVQCEIDDNCDRLAGGECTMSAGGNSWCTYDDSTCESGRRWSDLDVGDGLSGTCVGGDGADAAVADAGISVDGPSDALTVDAFIADADPMAPDATLDATPAHDATPIIAWDIVYIDEFSIGAPLDMSGVARIINVGDAPLDLSTLEVTDVSHDNPDQGLSAYVELETSPIEVTVPPVQAAGLANAEAAPFIGPLIVEPSADSTTDLLHVVAAQDGGGASYTLSATVRLEGLDASLSILVTNGAGGSEQPESAERVSAQ